MAWIVLGEDKGYIKMVSKKPAQGKRAGLLPKGSYLTVEPEENGSKFILRVDNSNQSEPYSPSPMIVDMDLTGLYADRKCQNIISAYRVCDISNRNDGLIDFIPPQSLARRSNQEEVDIALGNTEEGPVVFPATIHMGQNQLLVDDDLNFITAKLPEEMFFYQMQVCGKTGSGKTVAMKYLAQHFIEKMGGAVLAINVKETDFLMMDKPSISNDEINREWDMIGERARGITENYTIYYPANTRITATGVDQDLCQAITLDVGEIEPESLTGILQNISGIGAQSFPDIFRYWQQREMNPGNTFGDFVTWFNGHDQTLVFATLNIRGDESTVPMHRGTFGNILRNLNAVIEFFDNRQATSLKWDDILYEGKFSVINVTGDKGTEFGSILLRHLLKQIDKAKGNKESDVPILVIIDEVHQFYNTDASKEALGVLDTICRTGRSKKIGVIFASQNQEDLPRGISSVVNTKIFFKSDSIGRNSMGVSAEELQTLRKGYAVANIHELPQLKILKFPLSFSGVV